MELLVFPTNPGCNYTWQYTFPGPQLFDLNGTSSRNQGCPAGNGTTDGNGAWDY